MSETKSAELTIIGIGSSAGGLEAIRQLVETLPTESEVSYVVVQHMSSNHKSLMTALVARDTKLTVHDVEDGIVPQKNVVYITPPKADVIFMDGKLRLVDPSPEPGSPKPSVDRFLKSLAAEHGEKSMAIILSGTGRDGAYGVQAIREAGGITIAQDNKSAKYDGMPQSAVQTGCVDLVLSPTDIGLHLQKILDSQGDFAGLQGNPSSETATSDLLQILLARTRVDFRDYKQTTINRRIERRMLALNIQTEEEYTQFCRSNPSAVDALFKDLLISVTNFFRNQESFSELEALLPRLISESDGQKLRIWIAGCATGEEAYSIAMLLCEALGCPLSEFQGRVQIFATDIDRDALNAARQGIYGQSALANIPPDFAEKYLLRQKDEVRVIDSLRKAILFSDHNVCQDPPFQKIDLICCRNLLIYFNNALQKKVMGRFHYAMRKHGLLFLGNAESVAGSDDLFVAARETTHVYRKRVVRKPNDGTYSMPNIPAAHTNASRRKSDADQQRSADSIMLGALVRTLGENSILVSEDLFITQIFGDISNHIALDQRSSLRMHIDLLRSPFREEARSLVTIALRQKTQKTGIKHLGSGGSGEAFRLRVYPMQAEDINENAALVVFEPIDEAPKVEIKIDGDLGGTEVRRHISSLEDEVANTREALQQTIEELETSNEELQSLNEELQSSNEELQATNEELETSNEELQSTNEELITVNEELQVTSSELLGRTGELASVLDNSPMAMIVTDTALQVIQATLEALKMFGLERPLSKPHVSQFVLPENCPRLAPICSEAMKLGQTQSYEFTDGEKRVMIDCSPYFDPKGQVLGVTMVVTSASGLAREMEAIISSETVYVMHRNAEGKILRISEAYAKALGVSRKEATGRNIAEFLPPDVSAKLLASDLAVVNGKENNVSEVKEFKSVKIDETRHLDIHRFRFEDPTTGQVSVFTTGLDITKTVEALNEAATTAVQLKALQSIAGVGFWAIDLEDEHLEWSDEVHRIHGTEPGVYTPKLEDGLSFYHPDDREDVRKLVEQSISEGREYQFRKRLISKNNETIMVEAIGLPITNLAGETKKVVGFFKQIE